MAARANRSATAAQQLTVSTGPAVRPARSGRTRNACTTAQKRQQQSASDKKRAVALLAVNSRD